MTFLTKSSKHPAASEPPAKKPYVKMTRKNNRQEEPMIEVCLPNSPCPGGGTPSISVALEDAPAAVPMAETLANVRDVFCQVYNRDHPHLPPPKVTSRSVEPVTNEAWGMEEFEKYDRSIILNC